MDRSYINYRSKHLRHEATRRFPTIADISVCFRKRRQKTTVALNHKGYRSSPGSADKWDSYILAVITAGPRAADGRRSDDGTQPEQPSPSHSCRLRSHVDLYGTVPWQTKKPRRMYQHVFKHAPASIASRHRSPGPKPRRPNKLHGEK